MTPFLLLLAAYLLGAIPSSLVAGKVRGIDLRQHGSGNLGATNTYRVLGWRAALPVFAFDVFKGWFPTVMFPRWDQNSAATWALAYGAAAIIGHVFSVYVRFKGGKGVATSSGVLLALAPAAVAISMLVWAALVFLTGYVSLGSIVAALLVPILIYFLQGPGPVLWLTVALAVFVLVAHRANIGRLLRGEEHSFRKKKTGSAA